MHSKLAVISGASKGIGRATAISAANIGMDVLAIARNQSELNSLEQEIKKIGRTCYVCIGDLNSRETYENICSQLNSLNRPVSLLVHSAGIARVGKISTISETDWNSNIETNLNAPFRLTQKLLPFMAPNSHIIFVNSIGSRQAFPEWSAYCASKAGLKAFADVLREELRDIGIKVTSVFPASVDTPLHDSLPYEWDRKKMMSAAQVADTIIDCYNQPEQVVIKELDIENNAGTF